MSCNIRVLSYHCNTAFKKKTFVTTKDTFNLHVYNMHSRQRWGMGKVGLCAGEVCIMHLVGFLKFNETPSLTGIKSSSQDKD